MEHEELVPGQPGSETVTGLRRSLGTFDLTMLGIAAIIGAGIFAMVGNASNRGGPAVILLFIFAAIACGFAALCYAEFASKIPIAGSAYTYAYASFGELLAWIIGWDLLVEYAIGNIAVAISWSDYFTGLLEANGIKIPPNWTMDFRTASQGYQAVQDAIAGNGGTVESLRAACGGTDPAVTCSQLDAHAAWTNSPHIGSIPIIADLPALGIVFLITALVYVGIRESKTASNIMVARQARRHSARDRCRCVLCQHGELASIHAERIRRRDDRRLGGVLCVHRFRCAVDDCRRVQRPVQDTAARNDLFAHHLYRVVLHSRACADGHGQLSETRGRRSARICLRPGGRQHSMDVGNRCGQRDRRDSDRAACFPTRSAASVDGDEP